MHLRAPVSVVFRDFYNMQKIIYYTKCKRAKCLKIFKSKTYRFYFNLNNNKKHVS